MIRTALFFMLAVAACGRVPGPLDLAPNRPLPIVVSPSAGEPEKFAADELARYLGQITGRPFAVESASSALPEAGLVVGRSLAESLGETFPEERFGEDGFLLRRVGDRVLIAGANPRATLYAAYAFLERLGCGWYAPNFEFYGAAGGEHVPRVEHPAIEEALDVVEKPDFTLRQKYIEEGKTDTSANLVQMVDWMAKMRLNILECPIDYQGAGRSKWDNWRDAVMPEAKKRGILLEVGGHGYQIFLPAGRYFKDHPEWFGMDHAQRSNDPRVVFSTSNKEAMATYIANVVAYLKSHPEIDIFDCRPPDSSHWSTAPEDVALGTPTERQLLVVRQLARALQTERPQVKVLFEAYAALLAPPEQKISPPDNTVMEFCPINRSFLGPIDDAGIPENEEYFPKLEGWIHGTVKAGNVTIMTYITKYAWRSLPILVPHLIAQESARYHRMGLGGMSSYSEPGSWASLELDHYMHARCLWNAELDPDAELAAYARGRYGPAATQALAYLKLVEAVVPHAVGIPGTHLALESERGYVSRFAAAAQLLASAREAAAGDSKDLMLLSKLEGSRRYAANEMALRLALLEAGEGWKSEQVTRLQALLGERDKIIDQIRTQGLVLDSRNHW